MGKEDLLSREIVDCAVEVHRSLGPGLLESAYEQCFCTEIASRGLSFERQVHLPVHYKGSLVECGYRLDVVVDNLVVIEIKSVSKLEPVHVAQLLTYLKLSGMKLGFLLNFNSSLMKNGIRRVVNNL